MELNRDIQCLRGISVLLVVVVHFGVFYSLLPLNLAQNGFIGVDLFFVISGYIITKSIFNTGDRGQFLIKRIFRLVPLALFWMLLHGTISFYVYQFDISTDYLRPYYEIANEALNFVSLSMNKKMGSGFPHYWSLVVEWHFYIAVMLLMPLIKSLFRLYVTIAFLLLATLINLNSFTDNPFSTVNRLFEFIVGVYIALISYKFKFSNRLVIMIFLWALIFLLWISPNFFPYSKGNFSRSIIVYGVISGCIVYIASLNKDLIANIPIVGRALFNVGAISYSIYICHITIWNIFQTIIAWHAKNPPLWLHLLLLFISLFTISFFLYKYIEQPMRKIGANLVKKT